MGIALPGESAEYRAARDRLLVQEIALRRAMEEVAAARRELPPGGRVERDHVFDGAGEDGMPTEVRLSELFEPGKDSLVIYSFMFPRDPDDPTPGPPGGETAQLPLTEGLCPSCGALLDRLDGAAEHVAQHINFTSSPRHRYHAFWHSHASADGDGSSSCPPRATPITRTTSPKRQMGSSGRC
ncbi:MAG: DUF899 family protein [Solirubrobacterales bacterium]|nr:DUF899 family protein [Solirubrobacterales bacterium]